MLASLKTALWNQMGASIDMLIHTLSYSPTDYWQTDSRFYYMAFHSCLFLDYYSTFPPSHFAPPLSFAPTEAAQRPVGAIDDLIPDRLYSRQELLNYLFHSREKCESLIQGLTAEKLLDRFTEGDEEGDMDYPILEILLYNLRHTQHHVAQLNLMIRQDFDQHMPWSFRAGDLD